MINIAVILIIISTIKITGEFCTNDKYKLL